MYERNGRPDQRWIGDGDGGRGEGRGEGRGSEWVENGVPKPRQARAKSNQGWLAGWLAGCSCSVRTGITGAANLRM